MGLVRLDGVDWVLVDGQYLYWSVDYFSILVALADRDGRVFVVHPRFPDKGLVLRAWDALKGKA